MMPCRSFDLNLVSKGGEYSARARLAAPHPLDELPVGRHLRRCCVARGRRRRRRDGARDVHFRGARGRQPRGQHRGSHRCRGTGGRGLHCRGAGDEQPDAVPDAARRRQAGFLRIVRNVHHRRSCRRRVPAALHRCPLRDQSAHERFPRERRPRKRKRPAVPLRFTTTIHPGLPKRRRTSSNVHFCCVDAPEQYLERFSFEQGRVRVKGEREREEREK